MRNFKKYFFESLIQLTILANVFRQNNQFTSLTEPYFAEPGNNYQYSPLSYSIQNRYISGEIDLLLLNEDRLNGLARNHSTENQESLNNNYALKETQSYFDEMRMIDRLNRLTRPSTPQMIVQPASALCMVNNHKQTIDVSETRTLLNSIELNALNDNPMLRKEFEMEIELQTLIEQDIDLGIKDDLNFNINNQHQSHNYDTKYQMNNELDKMKNLFQNTFENSQKNQDLLTTTKFTDRCKFIEEDTGEILYQYNDTTPKNYQKNSQSLQNMKNLNITQNNHTKELSHVEMPVKHKPNDQQIVFTKPIFLSQTSVSKELNKLSETIGSTSNQSQVGSQSNSTNVNTLATLDERTLNEYLEEDLHTDFLNVDTFLNNDSSMIPDVFEFDEDFLKTFETNLTKFNSTIGSNNNSIMTQNSDNIYFNQTILTNSSIENNHSVQSNNLEAKKQLFQSSPNQISNHNDSESLNFLSDQLDLSLGDIFKTLNNNQINNSANNFTSFNTIVTDNKNMMSSNMIKNYADQQLPASVLLSHDDVKTFNDRTSNINVEVKKERVEIDEKYKNDIISSKPSEASNSMNSLTQRESRIFSYVIPTSDETLAAMRGLNHNHTYMDGARNEEESEVYHPYSYKNKLKKMLKNLKNNDSTNAPQQESRDQILLQENNISLSINRIVESNADEFNDIIKSIKLSSEQLSIVKDIRRRGKNKVAAQICRKRKIESIDSLKQDVEQLNEMKSLLNQEQEILEKEISDLTIKFDDLYQDLMGDDCDTNDPIMIYMNTLKSQLNLNTKLKQMNTRSVNSVESEIPADYESMSSQTSDLIDSDYDDEIQTYDVDGFMPKKIKVDQNVYVAKNKKFKN